MAEIKYEIKEKFGILSESAKGWTKELNLVSWNDKEPKYELREWDGFMIFECVRKLLKK